METIKNLSDETLVSRFRATKNNQFFKLLVKRYEYRLYTVAYRILENEDEAREMVQESFVRVIFNLNKYRTNVPFSAWIFTITHNLCKDFLRNKQRQSYYENMPASPLYLHEEEEPGNSYKYRIHHIVDRLPGPAQQLEEAEEKVFIGQLLAQLPVPQKKVIMLHDFEGLSYKQIAHLTGSAIGTVRSRLHYGRGKLKRIWKKCTEQDNRRKRIRYKAITKQVKAKK